MTLRDYWKVVRHRWWVIVVCAVVAGGVMWAITPANADTTQKVDSYTATATLLAATDADDDQTASPLPQSSSVLLARLALYVTTGEIPQRAAEQLAYEGDPAVLASGLTVKPDQAAMAITIAVTASDGARAAEVANAFADQTVAYFEENEAEPTAVSILQRATPIPDEPSAGFVVPPDRPIRTALASAIGLLLGIALALVLDHFDSGLRTRDEVHAALGMPVIADVPRLSRANRGRAKITVVADPLGHYANAYRAARTALVHVPAAQPQAPRRTALANNLTRGPETHVVLVTSAFASEGKTTSVANLAASFAETGQQVIVLDADLRSPYVHALFDVPQGAGASDFLVDPTATSVDALLRPTSIPGVTIMTAGTRLEAPASLASRLGPLVAELRSRAEVVIVDSAPLLAASDVFDVLPLADLVLIVARSGRLTAQSGQRVAELLGRFQVPVAGIILIGATAKGADGYGYGYGYGRAKTKKRASATPTADAAGRPPAPLSPRAVPEAIDVGDGEGRPRRRTSGS